jgi:hypothetical protein
MQTPINPKGFTNRDTIDSMFGVANPGTFTRTVGQPAPITPQVPPTPAAPIDPLTGLQIDPMANQSPNAPVPPPVGVKSNITLPYGLNTY